MCGGRCRSGRSLGWGTMADGPAPTRPRIPTTMQPLRPGDRGSAVAEVRRMLASIGLLDNTAAEFQDVYDELTELAIRHFQQRRGMRVDGRVGDETYAALTGA